LIEPLARTSKRFAALFFVFIFGIGAVLSFLDAGRRSAIHGDFGAHRHLLSLPVPRPLAACATG
jgi:hypothetical protein